MLRVFARGLDALLDVFLRCSALVDATAGGEENVGLVVSVSTESFSAAAGS
jgi:hypothetical protein